MNTSTVNSYYYGDESNQFSFFRIPRQLITGKRFKHISTDAKLLYGLLQEFLIYQMYLLYLLEHHPTKYLILF